MTHRYMIFDLQFGSTGKGQIAGSLGKVLNPDTVITAWAPNAGHTFRDGDKKYVHTMLATSAVLPSVKHILIGPGSVVNLQSLYNEIVAAGDAVKGKTIVIHPNAAILLPHHSEQEAAYVRIGSTMKGSAAAVIQKMHRDPGAINIAREFKEVIKLMISPANDIHMEVEVDEGVYDRMVEMSATTVIEGAQGASLSIHSSFYPYTTSRDVSVAQIAADCRVPMAHLDVVGVCRSYPIRVANRFDTEGKQIGTSGGYYPDQLELDWKKDLGREPELTTVTKLPRRVFSFSIEQIIQSTRLSCPTSIALTFCDYLTDTKVEVGDQAPVKVKQLVKRIQEVTGTYVTIVSFGPDTSDVFQLSPTGILQPLSDNCIIPF